MSLVERVVLVHDCLQQSPYPHAFGGALALAQIADPRGTIDVDVNVFAPAGEARQLERVLGAVGLAPEREADEWVPVAGIRFLWKDSPYPVDVFPSVDHRYERIARRIVHHPFGPNDLPLPFLSAEDLCVFKLSFGRAQDWVDLRSIAGARPDLDVEYIEDQVVGLRGPSMFPRVARLRALLGEVGG